MKPTLRHNQFIAYARYGLDCDTTTGQDFAQMGDMYIHSASLAIEIEAPNEVKELFTGED